MSRQENAAVARDLPKADTEVALHRCCGAGVKGTERGRSTLPRRPSSTLQGRLMAAREAAQALPVKGGAYALAGPQIGPGLKSWTVPQHGEACLSRTGLVSTRNSAKTKRKGLSGLSAAGKKQIQNVAALCNEWRRYMAFWTISLTDDDYDDLLASGKWNEFQARTRDLLTRHLKAAGNQAIVIGVVELGSKRNARRGKPDPHIHILCSGWNTKGPDGRHLVSKDVCDELVRKACQYVGLPARHRPAASQVKRVRKSVGGYMSKYLTKAQAVDLKKIPKEYHPLVPFHWWNQSSEAKALVEGHLVCLPPAFASFCERQRKVLESRLLGQGGLRRVGWKKGKIFPIPIEMYCFQFKSVEAIHQAMGLFVDWVHAGEPDHEEWLDLSG